MHRGYGLKYSNWNKGNYNYPYRCFLNCIKDNGKVTKKQLKIYKWIIKNISRYAWEPDPIPRWREIVDDRIHKVMPIVFYFDDKEDAFKLLLTWAPDVIFQTYDEWENLRKVN